MRVLEDVPSSVHHSPEEIRVDAGTRQHVANQMNYLKPQRLQHTDLV